VAEIGLRFGKREAIMFAKAFIAMLAALVAGGTAHAQQVTVTTPLYGVSDSFFESFGVGFGFGFPQGNLGGINSDSGRSSIVGFNPFPVGFGGGALPGFGVFDPGGGATFGWGVRGAGLMGGFALAAQQGSTRSSTMTAPSLTLTNGAPGFIAATTQRPFVTSFVPVVNGLGAGFAPVLPIYGPASLMPQYMPGPSVLQERIERLRKQGFTPSALSSGGRSISKPSRESELRDPFDARLSTAGQSTAGRPAASVAAIRQQHEQQQAAHEQKVAELRRKIDEADSAGKPQVARIYRQQLERLTGAVSPTAKTLTPAEP
jgi:hypothetical protein